MNSRVLYFFALALHITLIFVFSRWHLYRKNPAFQVWLLVDLGMNIAVMVLAAAGERAGYERMLFAKDLFWWALAAATLVWAVSYRQHAANVIVLRGAVALVVITIVARQAARIQFVGGAGPILANAMNLAYLAPTVYLVVALSGLHIDLTPIMAKLFHAPAGHAAELACAIARRVMNV